MMASEMVERCAAALARDGGLNFKDVSKSLQELYLNLAKIVITEMREPTEEMLRAMYSDEFCREMYRAAIDEALK